MTKTNFNKVQKQFQKTKFYENDALLRRRLTNLRNKLAVAKATGNVVQPSREVKLAACLHCKKAGCIPRKCLDKSDKYEKRW